MNRGKGGFPNDGTPEGWRVALWSDVAKPGPDGARWTVVDGVLTSSGTRGSWLMSKKTEPVKRHDGTDAPALKDRPASGHIGFQDLGREGARVRIRNARIRVLPEK